jgi:glycosyltransferase involved in cell wall biosynthesis
MNFQQNEDLISVIVPVYNVEPYLRRCVGSICNQTYKNIEIILVDDGSIDGSGKLSDWLATEDYRIRVFHQENGGASVARNHGIDWAKGNYFVFVDGDDQIHPEMIALLYHSLCMNNAMISLCRMMRVEEHGEYETRRFPADQMELVLNSSQSLRLLFENKLDCSMCLGLFRKELFNDCRFPAGKLNEDFNVLYRLLAKAEKVIYINRVLYYYYKRDYSSTCTNCFSPRRLDTYENCLEVLSRLSDDYPELVPCMESHLWYHAECIIKEQKKGDSDDCHHQAISNIRKKLRKDTFRILFNRDITCKQKVHYILISWCSFVYWIFAH